MKTIELINYISSHPEYNTIVIKDMDDMEPINAIHVLSCGIFDKEDWRINGSLEKNVLLVYEYP